MRFTPLLRGYETDLTRGGLSPALTWKMSLDAAVRGVFGKLFRCGTIQRNEAKTRLWQGLLASFPFASCKLAAFALT